MSLLLFSDSNINLGCMFVSLPQSFIADVHSYARTTFIDGAWENGCKRERWIGTTCFGCGCKTKGLQVGEGELVTL